MSVFTDSSHAVPTDNSHGSSSSSSHHTSSLFLDMMRGKWAPSMLQLWTSRAIPSTQLFEEITAIRAAMLWFAHQPQFAPMVNTFSKYATHHVLTSCLSRGACRNCQRCLHFMGWDVDHVGGMDICESILMSAYAEMVHDPIYSLQLAKKGISLIRQAIDDMAAMPEMADRYHKLLAQHLLAIKDKLFHVEDGVMKWVEEGKSHIPSGANHGGGIVNAPLLDDILKKGNDIYNHQFSGNANASSWLYVGLPEILAKIKAEGLQDEGKLTQIIDNVYQKWRRWGQENHTAIHLEENLPPSK